jgi:hypothetical protein
VLATRNEGSLYTESEKPISRSEVVTGTQTLTVLKLDKENGKGKAIPVTGHEGL